MRWSSASNSRIVTFTASNPAQGRSASPDGCSASSDGAAYPRTAAGLRVDDQGASDAVGPLAHAHEAVRVEAPGLAHREADAVVGDLEGPLLAVAAPGDRALARRGMALDVGHRLLGAAPQLTLLEDRQAPGLLGPDPALAPRSETQTAGHRALHAT